MAELKTKPTNKSVERFISRIGNSTKRSDCRALLEMMQKISDEKPVIWGDSIIGFGVYQYTQRNGQKGKWPLTGFSPRKQNISIYIMPGFSELSSELSSLGKHKHSVSCLYINKLADIHSPTLAKIIRKSVKQMRARYHS